MENEGRRRLLSVRFWPGARVTGGAINDSPSPADLILAGEQRAVKQLVAEQRSLHRSPQQETTASTAVDAELEREFAVNPFVEKIREVTAEHAGNFLFMAQQFEEQRIGDKLQKMGLGNAIDEYDLDLGNLAIGDTKEREVLLEALLKTRTAPITRKPIRLLGDIFSNRVENLVDNLLADGEHTGEYILPLTGRTVMPIQMRYRTRTIAGEPFKVITPLAYYQNPDYLNFHVFSNKQDDPNFTAGYGVEFNEAGEIVKISDRYMHLDGEVRGSKGDITNSFIKDNCADSEGFRDSGFIFEWDNLLTNPTFSIFTRKGGERYFNIFPDARFALDPSGEERFVLSERTKDESTFQVSPPFIQVSAMLAESLGNIPLLPIFV